MSVSVRPEAAAAAEGTPEELLFQPYRLGPYDLPHRIVMAPLTRSRARQPGNVPGPLNACYYAQRASAALIISEATQVSMQGQGYAWTPGIHSREQVEGWRLVTEAVHRAGGRIFNQLWHVGRISHPCLQPDYMLPVAPSAIKPNGMAFIENENGEGELVPFVTPRALQIEEMPYSRPTVLSRRQERHARRLRRRRDPRRQRLSAGAVHRFRHQSARRRVWRSGREPARLLMEVVETVIEVWGSDRVGVRLSPLSTFNDIADDDPETTFGYIADPLNDYRLAYLHIVNPSATALEQGTEPDPRATAMVELIRESYRGTLMIAGGFDRDRAEAWLEQGRADLIAFGRKFIANPDLPERFRLRAPLNPDDPSTYYGGGAKGYTAYPTLAQERGEQPWPCVDERWR